MKMHERIFEGIPVSPGIAIGHVHVVSRQGVVPVESRDLSAGEVEEEVLRFQHAVDQSREQLEQIHSKVAAPLSDSVGEIIKAQIMFLMDPEIIGRSEELIRASHKNAEYVFGGVVNEFVDKLRKLDDPLFQARDSDLLDVANRVTNNLMQRGGGMLLPGGQDIVLVAHDLAPSETTSLIKESVVAFVLEKGGPTSHTAIMAKALEIPAVVGIPNVASFLVQGAQIIVDGIAGRVICDPQEETLRRYRHEREDYEHFEIGLAKLRDEPAETLDGYAVALRANIELPDETDHVALHGARGVGLFRTEFVFMNREAPLSEEEQFALYREVVERVSPHSAVFRTVDIGGDKFLSTVEISPELNPYMGQRAIRLCLRHPEVFRTQLRAMLRASAYGRARILIPMISGLEEFVEVKRHVRELKAELRREGIPFDRHIEVGAMIEVPSAAMIADVLARECDFFSIGTNDLIQYSLAVDRGNEKVAYLYEPLHPAILRFLRDVTRAAHEAGISVSVCGEMAGDPMMATILIGIGVDELSMSAVSVPPVKKLIRSIRLGEAKLLAEEILAQSTIAGVRKIVNRRLKSYVRMQKIRKSHLLKCSEERSA